MKAGCTGPPRIARWTSVASEPAESLTGAPRPNVSHLQIIQNNWEHLCDYITGSFLANNSSFIQKRLEISTRTTAMVASSATKSRYLPITKLTQTIVQKVTKYNNAKYNIRIIE